MKNMKKLVSLLLAVCLMASLAIGASAAEPTTVDVSGGTGTSNVSLSSTSDGTLDGDPAATKMNVTIPTMFFTIPRTERSLERTANAPGKIT